MIGISLGTLVLVGLFGILMGMLILSLVAAKIVNDRGFHRD